MPKQRPTCQSRDQIRFRTFVEHLPGVQIDRTITKGLGIGNFWIWWRRNVRMGVQVPNTYRPEAVHCHLRQYVRAGYYIQVGAKLRFGTTELDSNGVGFCVCAKLNRAWHLCFKKVGLSSGKVKGRFGRLGYHFYFATCSSSQVFSS